MDPLELSQALIRCPSVTPEDGGALGVLTGPLKELGFECHRLKFSAGGTPDVENLYARLGADGRNFCYAGHTDVVPVGDVTAWTHDPFSAEVVDGKLYGRGAADMKTAIACFIAAVAGFLDARGKDFGGSISLLITGDEEGPAVNGTVKVLEWLHARGEKLDVCLVGEPTNPEKLGDLIKIGRRGSITGRLTVRGTAGHSAYPDLADNPIPRLLKLLGALIDTPLDEGTEHFEPSTVAITTIDVGNAATNVIPAQATAGFNIRFNDLHTGDSLKSWISGQLDGVGCAYDLETRLTGEAFLTPPGEISDLVAEASRKVTGRTPELGTSGGTSDARFIKDYCPVAEFGMAAKTMHKTDEHIVVANLAELTDIYRAVLEGYFPE